MRHAEYRVGPGGPGRVPSHQALLDISFLSYTWKHIINFSPEAASGIKSDEYVKALTASPCPESKLSGQSASDHT